MNRTAWLAITGTLTLTLAGCSTATKGAYPVSGKVTLSDGTPLTGGVITFVSSNKSASASIGPDGSYTLGSEKPGDGAYPGSYRISFSGDVLGGGYDNKPAQIHPKYGSPGTSGLNYEVKEGTNPPADFKLDKP